MIVWKFGKKWGNGQIIVNKAKFKSTCTEICVLYLITLNNITEIIDFY